MTTFYDILNVSENAAPEVIKAAYKALALKHHPDTNKGSAESALEMKKINEAYETLIDPPQRELYDAWLQQRKSGPYSPSQVRPDSPKNTPDAEANKSNTVRKSSDTPWYVLLLWLVNPAIGVVTYIIQAAVKEEKNPPPVQQTINLFGLKIYRKSSKGDFYGRILFSLLALWLSMVFIVEALSPKTEIGTPKHISDIIFLMAIASVSLASAAALVLYRWAILIGTSLTVIGFVSGCLPFAENNPSLQLLAAMSGLALLFCAAGLSILFPSAIGKKVSRVLLSGWSKLEPARKPFRAINKKTGIGNVNPTRQFWGFMLAVFSGLFFIGSVGQSDPTGKQLGSLLALGSFLFLFPKTNVLGRKAAKLVGIIIAIIVGCLLIYALFNGVAALPVSVAVIIGAVIIAIAVLRR